MESYEFREGINGLSNNFGIRVTRFENETVFDATENVLETIMRNLNKE